MVKNPLEPAPDQAAPVPADPAPTIADYDPERALALSYASAGARAGLAALLALDGTLAAVMRSARDPLIGQMRLTWWHGALSALDPANGGAVPRQPILTALARDVLPCGVAGAGLAAMIDGWEALLDPAPLDGDRLADYAAGRGAALFVAAGAVLGAAPGDPLARAGEGWALADLAAHAGDPGERAAATAQARTALAEATGVRWSRPARALGAMAHAARMTMRDPPVPPGSPRRVARLLRHRLTGR